MAKQVQLRRGTTAQHSAFTGALGEVTVDTDKKILVVHDGSTAGGIPLAKDSTVVHNSGNETVAGVKTFSSSPIVPTATTGTQAVNKDYADTKVAKVTSTDNAIVRFDGITGQVQNSNVYIKDTGNLLVGTTTDNGVDKLQVNGSIKATELNVSANFITKVSKNVPGVGSNDYTDKYFILFKTPTWGLSDANYGVKGSLIAERHNNLGLTVYTDFSVGCGRNNEIYKTYFQNKGNVGTSLVYVTINSIQYVAIYWYTAPTQYYAWFDGFITNINASSAIDNLCGTIFETAQNALSRIII